MIVDLMKERKKVWDSIPQFHGKGIYYRYWHVSAPQRMLDRKTTPFDISSNIREIIIANLDRIECTRHTEI